MQGRLSTPPPGRANVSRPLPPQCEQGRDDGFLSFRVAAFFSFELPQNIKPSNQGRHAPPLWQRFSPSRDGEFIMGFKLNGCQ